jgi:hypothetical protein
MYVSKLAKRLCLVPLGSRLCDTLHDCPELIPIGTKLRLALSFERAV